MGDYIAPNSKLDESFVLDILLLFLTALLSFALEAFNILPILLRSTASPAARFILLVVRAGRDIACEGGGHPAWKKISYSKIKLQLSFSLLL
jgi:hypothetical protein